MRTKLNTDFREHYDFQFDPYLEDSRDLTFHRMSRTTLDKSQQLLLLQTLGLAVPPFGTVEELYRQTIRMFGRDSKHILDWIGQQYVVVYTDPLAHAGTGKVRCSFDQALQTNSMDFSTLWLGPGSISYRFLQIGERAFWLKYESPSSWRSNVGDVRITILEEGQSMSIEEIPYALFAIDFIPSIEYGFLALDFNTSPGITGTGMENILSPTQIYDHITGRLLCMSELLR